MPIPKPKKTESRSDYVARVVDFLSKENYSQKQALAVAYDIWMKENDPNN